MTWRSREVIPGCVEKRTFLLLFFLPSLSLFFFPLLLSSFLLPVFRSWMEGLLLYKILKLLGFDLLNSSAEVGMYVVFSTCLTPFWDYRRYIQSQR